MGWRWRKGKEKETTYYLRHFDGDDESVRLAISPPRPHRRLHRHVGIHFSQGKTIGFSTFHRRRCIRIFILQYSLFLRTQRVQRRRLRCHFLNQLFHRFYFDGLRRLMQRMRWRKQREWDINGARFEFSFRCDIGGSECTRELERALGLNTLKSEFYKLIRRKRGRQEKDRKRMRQWLCAA